MLIVGLGNPGLKYRYTRHNVGFLTVDAIAEELNIPVKTIKFKGLYGEGRIGSKKVRLLKPETYMNLSGESVREAMNYFKIPPEEVLVLVDDIDIEFGSIRIRKKGSAGTHNGLKSIIYQIQSDTFPRIKLGVGQKLPQQDLASFVLSGFSTDEGKVIEKTIETAKDAAIEIVKNGVDIGMNKYNSKK
ncbi:aminoacyl-tRNA hydrolase [Peptoniphilus sp. KCTC 25270]|uniref:aminoacyl-tRNA hydrolase n=1 Tax=Peptoniphilus sp. KCTC 25270 TaxID=2897414 RepID=UPI001E6085FF|nr:aminoacyl-tRNA hydrolase [Peptoniphilus sp. KCTC 25270]MCD1146815.1 aminoacyl-tRNA hydrolase [Peptoniphilus sp. KCTC 25270]